PLLLLVVPSFPTRRSSDLRRHPDWLFSELNSPAHLYLCLRFAGHLAMPQCKTRGRVDRYSFLVRLFHPPLQTGLSRRTVTSNRLDRKSTRLNSSHQIISYA